MACRTVGDGIQPRYLLEPEFLHDPPLPGYSSRAVAAPSLSWIKDG